MSWHFVAINVDWAALPAGLWLQLILLNSSRFVQLLSPRHGDIFGVLCAQSAAQRDAVNPQLLENSDKTFVIDNEALFSILHDVHVLKQNDPEYKDLHFSDNDLRKMGANLVPFPRLHFFLCAQSPLFAPDQVGKVKLTVQEVNDRGVDP